jgi:hypothetical protein
MLTNESQIIVEKNTIKLENCVLEKQFLGSEAIFSISLLSQTNCLNPENNLFLKGDFSVKEFYEIQY